MSAYDRNYLEALRVTKKELKQEREDLTAEIARLRGELQEREDEIEELRESVNDLMTDNEKVCESLDDCRRIGALLLKWVKELEEEEEGWVIEKE